ncbi:MAG: undecaprenyl diphosphate synthase family protein, partial [Spirochaetaceae bacterium]|nr:undecaprenyl diphosphate synthase family protein [Spirochaetaceae bacterium]
MAEQLDKNNVPVHVGIIMDGNGRWAQKRNLPRTAGHREGLEAAKRIVSSAVDAGVKYLTLYTFSTEN